MTTTTKIRETETTMTPSLVADPALRLIASDDVEGLSVYDKTGDKIGSVAKLMFSKLDGRIEYLVIGFGGLFGMGEDFYPVPWDTVSYDPRVEGFRLKHIAKDDLDNATAVSFKSESDLEWNAELDRRIRLFYLGQPVAVAA